VKDVSDNVNTLGFGVKTKAAKNAHQAVISPVSGVLKVTERPGTMVEMACL
jgi:hypothetical protein